MINLILKKFLKQNNVSTLIKFLNKNHLFNKTLLYHKMFNFHKIKYNYKGKQ